VTEAQLSSLALSPPGQASLATRIQNFPSRPRQLPRHPHRSGNALTHRTAAAACIIPVKRGTYILNEHGSSQTQQVSAARNQVQSLIITGSTQCGMSGRHPGHPGDEAHRVECTTTALVILKASLAVAPVTESQPSEEGLRATLSERRSMLVAHACSHMHGSTSVALYVSDWTKTHLDALRGPANIRFII
jgi:hypothetical protein